MTRCWFLHSAICSVLRSWTGASDPRKSRSLHAIAVRRWAWVWCDMRGREKAFGQWEPVQSMTSIAVTSKNLSNCKRFYHFYLWEQVAGPLCDLKFWIGNAMFTNVSTCFPCLVSDGFRVEVEVPNKIRWQLCWQLPRAVHLEDPRLVSRPVVV
jgi:hypothetical protein